MTSRTRLGFGLGAAAVAVMMLGPAVENISAQGPGGGRFGGPGRPGGPMAGWGGPGPGGFLPLMRLDLSSDQRDRVRQVMESHRGEQRALGEKARAAHQALQDLLSSPNADEGTIRARAADVAGIEADAAVLHARIFSEVYQILTPEQQQTFAEMKAKRAERIRQFEQRRQNRQPGPPQAD